MHQISLQEQHKAFMLVHGRLRKQQRKQEKYASKNRKDITYQTGDPVYWKKHKREGKINTYFAPFYRVIEQNKIQKLSSFKSNENIHKREDGSYYVVSANKASSVTL